MTRRWVWVFLVLFFLGSLFYSLALSKDSDDEVIYTALAAKIKSQALLAYNLRDVSIKPEGVFWKLEPESGGHLLGLLSKSGISYYDTDLFFNPPLFPVLLFFSHELLNPSKPFFLLRRGAAPALYGEQLYAAFPNVLLGTLFLWGVFALGRQFLPERSAFLGLWFCFTSPVFWVVTFKVWTDLLAAALILWAFILWNRERSSWIRVFLSGAGFGLAVLTRTASLFAVLIFLRRHRLKESALWILTALLVSGFWFYQLYDSYGHPFYFPAAAWARQNLDWLKSISKPWYFYLLDLLYLSPACVLALWAWEKKNRVLFLWFISFLIPLCFFLYSAKPLGLEDRYLLGAYPALWVLAASGFERLKRLWPRVLVYAVIAGASFWSLRIAYFLVSSRVSLNFVPY